MTKSNMKTEKIEMRVDPEFKQAVKDKAESKGVTITRWIETVLRRSLKRKSPNKSG